MGKKPINMLVKNANEAEKRLNDYVEDGGSDFRIGISTEYVTTTVVNSDGTKSYRKEKRYRIMGFVDTVSQSEVEALKSVKKEMNAMKNARDAMNRKLNIMNKRPFAPLSVLLLCSGILMFALGILTITGVLPLPSEQKTIALVLTILGAVCIAGSFITYAVRKKKKTALLAIKDQVLKEDAELVEKERAFDVKVPDWYKKAHWHVEGSTLFNSANRFEF